jgi:hypothetical protein
MEQTERRGNKVLLAELKANNNPETVSTNNNNDREDL